MVVVELLNDVALRGKLVEADDSMKCAPAPTYAVGRGFPPADDWFTLDAWGGGRSVSLTDVVSEGPDGDRKELGQVWVKVRAPLPLAFSRNASVLAWSSRPAPSRGSTSTGLAAMPIRPAWSPHPGGAQAAAARQLHLLTYCHAFQRRWLYCTY
jgi:hypothetical protein